MGAALGAQVPIRIGALDGQRRAADAGLVPRRRLDDLRLVALALGPAEIHAHQHLRPVRGVGPADAGAEREHRVAVVVWTGELCLERRVRDLIAERGEFALEVGLHRGIVGQRCELGQVGRASAERLPSIEACAQEADALQEPLRVLAIVPEIGTRGLRF